MSVEYRWLPFITTNDPQLLQLKELDFPHTVWAVTEKSQEF